MTENETKLDVSIGAGDIVHLTIGGKIASPKEPLFVDWVKKTKETIRELFDKKKERVSCLVDITGLSEYHPEVITELVQMMKENEPYVLRTATFGGNAYMTMAEDVIIALSGRKNLRPFKTRDEALAWLRDGGDEAVSTV